MSREQATHGKAIGGGLPVLPKIGKNYTTAFDRQTVRLASNLTWYDETVKDRFPSWEKCEVGDESACFDPTNQISTLGFLATLIFAGYTNMIHEGDEMWILPNYVSELPTIYPQQSHVCEEQGNISSLFSSKCRQPITNTIAILSRSSEFNAEEDVRHQLSHCWIRQGNRSFYAVFHKDTASICWLLGRKSLAGLPTTMMNLQWVLSISKIWTRHPS